MAGRQIVFRRLGVHERLAEAFLLELTRRDPDGTRLAAAIDVDQAASLAADAVLDPGVWPGRRRSGRSTTPTPSAACWAEMVDQ